MSAASVVGLDGDPLILSGKEIGWASFFERRRINGGDDAASE